MTGAWLFLFVVPKIQTNSLHFSDVKSHGCKRVNDFGDSSLTSQAEKSNLTLLVQHQEPVPEDRGFEIVVETVGEHDHCAWMVSDKIQDHTSNKITSCSKSSYH